MMMMMGAVGGGMLPFQRYRREIFVEFPCVVFISDYYDKVQMGRQEGDHKRISRSSTGKVFFSWDHSDIQRLIS